MTSDIVVRTLLGVKDCDQAGRWMGARIKIVKYVAYDKKVVCEIHESYYSLTNSNLAPCTHAHRSTQ